VRANADHPRTVQAVAVLHRRGEGILLVVIFHPFRDHDVFFFHNSMVPSWVYPSAYDLSGWLAFCNDSEMSVWGWMSFHLPASRRKILVARWSTVIGLPSALIFSPCSTHSV